MAAIENIGNALLKNTSLSETQVDIILSTDSKEGGNLHEAIARKNFSNIDEVMAMVCGELGVEFLKDVPVNDIPVDFIRNIPINYSKNNQVLPFKDDNGVMLVLVSNPLNLKALDDIKAMFQKPVRPIVTTTYRLQDAINRVYEKGTANFEGLESVEDEDNDLDETIIDLLEAGDDDAPVIKLVNTLLFRAVKEKVSDIHIEPYERDVVVRFRVDGELYDVFRPPKKLQNAITSRIKVMGNLNIAEKRLPQDGRIPLKLAGKDIDIRLNSVPTTYGERLVMRLQDRSKVVLQLEQLGFSDHVLGRFDTLLKKSYGIILVTGPTGSGKSTTLYAGLMKINSIDRNIITVEDPVEQRIHGIGQIPVNAKIGLTFASGLRAILRQDPDVIMIGEIRDSETADIAINAALTGHLVLSTIHTNDSAGAIPRMIDMGCEPFLIASSVLGVAAQRLVRVLCPHCKEPYNPTAEDMAILEITEEVARQHTIYRPVGCSQCNNKGYIGQTNISELMMISDEVRQLILQRKDGNSIKKLALSQGMISIRQDGARKVLSGVTTIQELLASSQKDE